MPDIRSLEMQEIGVASRVFLHNILSPPHPLDSEEFSSNLASVFVLAVKEG